MSTSDLADLIQHLKKGDGVLFLGNDLPLGYPGAPSVPPELARDAMRQSDDFGTLVFLLVFALLTIVGYRYLAQRENRDA